MSDEAVGLLVSPDTRAHIKNPDPWISMQQ